MGNNEDLDLGALLGQQGWWNSGNGGGGGNGYGNPAPAATGPAWNSMAGIFGGKDSQGMGSNGWGGTALSVVQGLGNAYMSMKQYGLAKDTLKFNKEQFAKNFGAQQKMTNSRLQDRQAARVASNAGAYQSVGDYMKQNGI